MLKKFPIAIRHLIENESGVFLIPSHSPLPSDHSPLPSDHLCELLGPVTDPAVSIFINELAMIGKTFSANVSLEVCAPLIKFGFFY